VLEIATCYLPTRRGNPAIALRCRTVEAIRQDSTFTDKSACQRALAYIYPWHPTPTGFIKWVTHVSCQLPVAVAFLALLGLTGCADEATHDGAGCVPCRAASGRFETRTFKTPSTAGNWYATDLDLDGRDELVVARSSELSRVYSVDATRGLDELASFPAATWASIGDVTNDGRPDLLLGGTSFVAFRATAQGGFAALDGASTPVSGEMSGHVSVTKFPVVGRWRSPTSPEPLIVKDLYHLSERSLLPTQVESFSSAAGDVASGGNADLRTLLKLSKRFVAIDLEGDGLDELWGIDLLGRLVQMARVAGAQGGSWSVGESRAVDDPAQIAVGDANGDGVADLVAQSSALVVTGGSEAEAGRVHELALPEPAAACVWIQLDADLERELVCSAAADEIAGELLAYDADFSHDQLARRAALEVPSSERLVVGDFDGNGIEDLATLGEELTIAFGIPAP
jgi:hypothetical protein